MKNSSKTIISSERVKMKKNDLLHIQPNGLAQD